MHRAAILAALLLALPAAASAETLLSLSDTETVTVAPDELAASLQAEATSTSPADAQRRVNAAMASALAKARTVAGVHIDTGAYAVWRTAPTPQDHAGHWQASQTLNLSSHDGTALLGLVGSLQDAGMTIGELNWRLSGAAERAAHDKALRAAITALRGKAQQAADLLDLRFDSFKQVRLGSANPPPMPRFAMAMAAPGAAPPSAVAADVPVSASADADAILVPKQAGPRARPAGPPRCPISDARPRCRIGDGRQGRPTAIPAQRCPSGDARAASPPARPAQPDRRDVRSAMPRPRCRSPMPALTRSAKLQR